MLNGQTIDVSATRGPVHGTSHRIDFTWTGDASFAEIIDAMGELPIPPYLNRETQESDKTNYQTVYSKIKGSVAAPTAGLHFTPEVLADLDAHGIQREELTLHVGAGTFKPVKSEEIEGHEMHTEYVSVRRDTIQKLIAHEGCAIAVGTTSVRTLESLYYMGLKVMRNSSLNEDQLHVAQWEPYESRNEECEVRSVEALQALADWMDAHGLRLDGCPWSYRAPQQHPDHHRPRLRLSYREDACHELPSAAIHVAAAGKRLCKRRLA